VSLRLDSESDHCKVGFVTDADGAADRYPLRTSKARQTRLALITAALDLFSSQGYGATTVDAIARRAGVSRPTVFTSVPGGKPQLLKEARDLALAGDDEPIPVPQRPWFLHAMGQTDPAEVLRLQSANIRMLQERSAALEVSMHAAAASDGVIAELDRSANSQRRMGASFVIRRLHELDGLRSGLTQDEATDTYFALASPEVYLMLVRQCGWTADAYEQWLSAQLAWALLGLG
jgi:AcrR family transcriptional regulator